MTPAEALETKQELPIIARRTLVASGDSIMISIPRDWLKQKGLDKGDKVILIANGNLTIHKDEADIVQKLAASLKESLEVKE